eukprot:4789446-Alexandrium_andersonii.AAC.1
MSAQLQRLQPPPRPRPCELATLRDARAAGPNCDSPRSLGRWGARPLRRFGCAPSARSGSGPAGRSVSDA